MRQYDSIRRHASRTWRKGESFGLAGKILSGPGERLLVSKGRPDLRQCAQRAAFSGAGRKGFSRHAVKIDTFFSELKRRNVYKVAVAYIVAGWALSQGIAQVLPVF